MGQAGREDPERGDEHAPGEQDARRLPRPDLVLRPQLRQDHRHRHTGDRGESVTLRWRIQQIHDFLLPSEALEVNGPY